MLNWNRYDLLAGQDEVIAVALAVIQHDMDLEKVAGFFEGHAVRLDLGGG